MASLDNVLAQMASNGMPPLPAGHPICDGKERRFGPKKQAWYKLTEVGSKEGNTVVYGAFGHWSGTHNGAVGVTLQDDEVSADDMAAARKRQEEVAAEEALKKDIAAKMAANRARAQWAEGLTDAVSPYLERKQVINERALVTADGTLLVPLKKYSLEGAELVGLQKIAPDGSKMFNKGMDKVGAGCLLGKMMIDGVPPSVILTGEGFATGLSVRMAVNHDYPFMVAIDAGNLLPVALRLRADFPDALLVLAADDDWQLEKRLAKTLIKDFCIASTFVIDGIQQDVVLSDFDDVDLALTKRFLSVPLGPALDLPIDGHEYIFNAEDGSAVSVIATRKLDACGIAYIEANIVSGRQNRTILFENAGIATATAAAVAVGNAIVVTPRFNDRGANKWTDFNDLHVHQSLQAVGEQIRDAIFNAVLMQATAESKNNPESATESASETGMPAGAVTNTESPSVDSDVTALEVPAHLDQAPPLDSEVPSADAAEPGAGNGGKKPPKKVYPKEFWEKVDYLLENFVLIYGTDDAWDAQNRMILKVGHMRLAHSSDAVKFWLNNGDRKMVNKDQVVFDPTMTCDADSTVNLYHGFDMEPKKGECNYILDLLCHLCDEDQDVIDWVLKWIAYPLQNKGAKMRTSIIIHGDEGSGKNLFWENVVKQIYGEYGGVIGNAQIESQFNEWASKKLFFVADEVVTRHELRQLKGKLKHMITGESIMINPKNMTERSEANHMNFVFLSNELQPLALDKTDRRYLVLWTPQNKPAEFYKSVAVQSANGGVAAFYEFLMALDLGDFDEHTKPLETDAKKRLIGLGLSPPEKFYREWSAGFLPLPFMCCSAMQLYAGFCRWCHLNGERFPPTQTLFGRSIDRIGFGAIHRSIVKYGVGNEVKQRTVYIVGDQPNDGTSRSDWVEAASNLFEDSLKKYRHVYDQTSDVNG